LIFIKFDFSYTFILKITDKIIEIKIRK